MQLNADHDPARLFAFALRERDWVLADLVAVTMRGEPGVTAVLERATFEVATGSSAPDSLSSLHVLARLIRGLGLER